VHSVICIAVLPAHLKFKASNFDVNNEQLHGRTFIDKLPCKGANDCICAYNPTGCATAGIPQTADVWT
jgi:hypothetical protein